MKDIENTNKDEDEIITLENLEILWKIGKEQQLNNPDIAFSIANREKKDK